MNTQLGYVAFKTKAIRYKNAAGNWVEAEGFYLNLETDIMSISLTPTLDAELDMNQEVDFCDDDSAAVVTVDGIRTVMFFIQERTLH